VATGQRRRSRAPPLTNAENNYDYAGQDPINNYDLNGLRPAVENPQDFAIWYPNAGSNQALISTGGPSGGGPTTANHWIVEAAKVLLQEQQQWEHDRWGLHGYKRNNNPNPVTTSDLYLTTAGLIKAAHNNGLGGLYWLYKEAIQCAAGALAVGGAFPPPYDIPAALGGCFVGAALPPGSTGPPP
jgi:hypothetical protein